MVSARRELITCQKVLLPVKLPVIIFTSDPNLMQFLTMDCKRNPTLEEIDQYAEKELELKRAQKQQQQEWMDQMYQEEIEAFDAAFQKLVDEGFFQKLIIFDPKFFFLIIFDHDFFLKIKRCHSTNSR